jgi:hypothetical protein
LTLDIWLSHQHHLINKELVNLSAQNQLFLTRDEIEKSGGIRLAGWLLFIRRT